MTGAAPAPLISLLPKLTLADLVRKVAMMSPVPELKIAGTTSAATLTPSRRENYYTENSDALKKPKHAALTRALAENAATQRLQTDPQAITAAANGDAKKISNSKSNFEMSHKIFQVMKSYFERYLCYDTIINE